MRLRLGRVLGAAILGIFAIWTLAPLGLMLHTSLTYSGIATEASTTHVGLENYHQVVADQNGAFWRSALVSVTISAVVCALSFLLGAPAAYVLVRRRGRAVRVVGDWIFSTRSLPPVVAAIPLFIVFSKIGLAGTMTGLVLMDLLLGLPFVVWVLRSYIEDLPTNLGALAQVDELGIWRTLWRVILPNLRMPIVAVGGMTWLLVWNEYLFALIFSGSMRPLPVLVSSWNTYQGVQWGPACAAGVLTIAPVLLTLLVSIRLLLRGFAFGWKAPVKGEAGGG